MLLVRSTDAIPEPFVTFLVEVNWARGRLMREYTVLLDPPVYTPGENGQHGGSRGGAEHGALAPAAAPAAASQHRPRPQTPQPAAGRESRRRKCAAAPQRRSAAPHAGVRGRRRAPRQPATASPRAIR